MERSGSMLAGAPFLRLLVPLCIGVTIPSGILLAFPLTGIAVVFSGFVLLLKFRNVPFQFQAGWTFLLFLLILFFGMIRVRQETQVFPGLPGQTFRIVLDDYPQEKENSRQVIGRMVNSKARIIVYLPKSQQVSEALPGSVMVFEGQPETIRNDGNPFEFNYRRYLNDRGIGYRIFLKEGQYYFQPEAGLPDVYQAALIIRKKLVESLSRSGLDSQHVPLVASIAFGAREEVDRETVRAFTNTGVIHVLAVSGMNVGLLYVILDLLFRFLKRGRVGSVVHTVLMISAIWSYTLVSGMSASILRAAVMFTFVTIGTHFRRNATILNSLAVSAFLLIAINPFIIRDIGFQLSYAALLSIVLIQPKIYHWVSFKNILADKAWMLFSVTLAAQAGTLPFTLLYFHQFPAYFWLANMLVVPLVTLILYLAVLLTFLAQFSGFAGSLVARVLDWLTGAVMTTVEQVERLPHAVIRGFYPDKPEVLLLTLMAILLYIYWKLRKVQILFFFLVAALSFSIYAGTGIYRRQARQEAIFFNIPGARVLALTSGRKAVVLSDREEWGQERLRRYLEPYLGERGINYSDIRVLKYTSVTDGRNPEMAGTKVIFNNILIFIQHRGVDSASGNLPKGVDFAWIKNGSGTGSVLSFNAQTDFRGPLNADSVQDSSGTPESLRFKLDRAVIVTIRSSGGSGKPEYICDYFDREP